MHDWDRARGRKHAARESTSRRRKRRFFKTTARDGSSVRAVVLLRADNESARCQGLGFEGLAEIQSLAFLAEEKRCATGVRQRVWRG